MPTRPHLLVAFAHPDDEAFGVGGTMARFAEDGWKITVLCATRGEVGEIADPALATPETLGEVREQELRDACAVLGVHDVHFLDYRDSGMEGTPDNEDPRAFCNAVANVAAEQIAAFIRATGPDVVVTWDPSGGYGHPDHITMHRLVTAAFAIAAALPGGPVALYYTAMDTSVFAEIAQELAKLGIPFGNPEMRERMEKLPRLAATTRIDVSAYVDRKGEALLAHRTQMPPDSFMNKVPPALRQRFLGSESFHRARPAWHQGDELETSFWAGSKL